MSKVFLAWLFLALAPAAHCAWLSSPSTSSSARIVLTTVRRRRPPPRSALKMSVDHDDDDEDDDDYIQSDDNKDWLQAELFLLHCPEEPDPTLTPETVARTVARSLQFVDYPYENAGLERCYDFLTFDCRKAVTGRQGGASVERFIEYGQLAPALQPFMGAQSIDLDATTYTPPQPPHRGALASLGVTITGAELWQLQHPSGLERAGGTSMATQPPMTHMVMRLEQQRRPPLQDCWLVKEVLDVRYAFAGDMGNEIPE